MNDRSEEGAVRLNKYLAQQGVATRRDADALITSGRVFVNGERAVVGMKVTGADQVDVRWRGRQRAFSYFAFNKPRGIITHSPGTNEEDISAILPADVAELNVFPIGRLDKDSHGLILLTNDGRVTDRLLSPDALHEKEYTVRTKLPLRNSFKEHMEAGVDIEGYTTKPARVRITGEKSFSITIIEGKKHQIRRMVVAMHNEVADLRRTRIMNIRLGNLASGSIRAIEGEELKAFLSALQLK